MIFASLILAAAAPATPSTAPPDARAYRYVVKDGDTLLHLTAAYFQGNAGLSLVLKASGLPETRKLRRGETLIIPYRAMRRAPVDGAVAAFRGPVELGGKGAGLGSAVSEGMTIATGVNASASIKFPDGTIASIPSNSRIRVLRLSRYILTGEVDREFIVDEGGSEWQVTPAKLPGDRLQVRTPLAVSAVRGTEFRVTYKPDGKLSGSSVVKGEVGFSTGAAPVPLPKGFGAATDVARKVDKRVLLAAPVLAPGYERQADTDVAFGLAPVAGARAYKIVIARDEGFVDRVAELRSAEPGATFSDIADGSYFVRVSAIDSVNLEGFARDAAFVRKFGPLQAAGVDPVATGNRFSWVSVGKGSGSFRFTLSRTADLSNPILDVAALSDSAITVTGLRSGTYYWQVSTNRFDASTLKTITTGVQSVKIERR